MYINLLNQKFTGYKSTPEDIIPNDVSLVSFNEGPRHLNNEAGDWSEV